MRASWCLARGGGDVHIGQFRLRTRVRLTFCTDLPLVLQIALVAHHDDGKVVFVLRIRECVGGDSFPEYRSNRVPEVTVDV